MNLETIQVESIFEESTCTTCGRFGVDKFSSIVDSFIKYKNILISFVEIIKKTLDFTPTNENCSMEICEHCKLKLQDFYCFRMRSEDARKIQNEFTSETAIQKLLELDKEIKDPIIYSTVQVVREYVEKYSINSINIEESTKRLIINSNSQEEVPIEIAEVILNPQEELIEEIDPIITEENETVEEVTEYVEDYIEEASDDGIQIEEPDDSEIMSFAEDITSEDIQNDKSSNLKRPRHPEKWACNQRKTLRNSGQSYINSKGKQVGPRKMLPSCGSSCRNRCDSKVTHSDREINFYHYWSLGDIVEQRKYISDHIITKEPTRRKVQNSSRTLTLQFYLDIKNGNDQISITHVCKKMFKNTLAVSSQVIQGVVRKYVKTGFIDTRGKHKRKLTEAQELARQHVQKFPYFYIDQNVTKIQLYNMYCEECKNVGLKPVKESNYRDIFDKFHSNSFLKSDKILCEKCHKYYKSADEQRMLLQKDHDEHLAVDRKCRDRALGRIRHRRSLERKRAEKLANISYENNSII